MNEKEFIIRAKEILEMGLKAEELRKALSQQCDNYFIEKAERALKCLEDKY